MRINRYNFILYLAGGLGILLVLSVGVLLMQKQATTSVSLPTRANACVAQFSLARLSDCPVGDCWEDGRPVIYQGEDNVEVGLLLNTGGQNVIASSAYLTYNPSQFSHFEVKNGENAFSDPIIDVSNGVVQAHHFSLDGLSGEAIHLISLVFTPAAGVGEVEFSFDYQGCGADSGSMVVSEAAGNILAQPEVFRFVLRPYPTSTPVPTSKPSPTETPLPTHTPTPEPTLTPLPSPRPTPTSLPLPTPTPTLAPGACTESDLSQCTAPENVCVQVACQSGACIYPTLAYRQPCPGQEGICLNGYCCLNEIDYAGSEGHCDGKISAIDFQAWLGMFRDYILAKTDAEQEAAYRVEADLNSDGKISALDFPEFVRLWRANQ